MASTGDKLQILSVGSNAVSAFVAWRLTASTSTDVSLVWKSQFDIVNNYGLHMKSAALGSDRYRPFAVAKTVEEVAAPARGFDYVVLCVKALPDVYDLAAVIAPVVTPGHTCIVVNTTAGLGIEAYLETAYADNVVLSLVAGAAVSQTGPAEFEHTGPAEFWLGAANRRAAAPESLLADMVESFSLTLGAGGVTCHASPNIRQQQWEHSVAPIAFGALSVLLDEPQPGALLAQPRVASILTALIDELLRIAAVQSCTFPADFAKKTMDAVVAQGKQTVMYQDYLARRPMELEVMLHNPLKIAETFAVATPRLELVYLMLVQVNKINQTRPASTAPSRANSVLSKSRSAVMAAPQRRAPGPPPPQPQRAQSMNGLGPGQGYPTLSRQNSLEGLEEFSEVVAFADGDMTIDYTAQPPMAPPAATGYAQSPGGYMPSPGGYVQSPGGYVPSPGGYMPSPGGHAPPRPGYGRAPSGRGPPARPPLPAGADADADADDYFVPASAGPVPENFDMLSMTTRRNRRTGSFARKAGEPDPTPGAFSLGRFRRNSRKSSGTASPEALGFYESFIDSPIMAYTSDRYGDVDTKVLTNHSRTSSMTSTASRGGFPGGPPARRFRSGPSPPGSVPPDGYAYPPSRPSPSSRSPSFSHYQPPRNMVRSMMGGAGPSPMEALTQAAASMKVADMVPDENLMAKDPHRGSGPGSGSASNENGSANSSSTSSLDQK
ncbi:ketopantoate reductase PanE/ApbA-domain-containing protein [Dipodascopsis tothii]|uniref:ketopantoate reductase PanE/ApbA-domain-containing protein n=1 Tax=Dipodascopsis tothii TaxID=44089 RepID=UPI0034CFB912